MGEFKRRKRIRNGGEYGLKERAKKGSEWVSKG